MSIDVAKEDLLTFGQAAKLLPRRRQGRPVNPATLWRWARKGVRCGAERVHLEVVRLPSGWATTTGSLTRFLERLTTAEDLSTEPTQDQNCDLKDAVEELDADGV